MESKGATVDTSKNKIFFAILGVLGILIIGLIVAIVVTKNLPKDTDGLVDESEVQEVTPSEKTESEQIYEQYSDSINAELQNMPVEDKDGALALYEYYIGEVDDEEVKNMLSVDYYQLIMLYDVDKTQKDLVISGLLEKDNALKNVSSAVVITNAASYYGDESLLEQYENILMERQTADGFDLNMETDG